MQLNNSESTTWRREAVRTFERSEKDVTDDRDHSRTERDGVVCDFEMSDGIVVLENGSKLTEPHSLLERWGKLRLLTLAENEGVVEESGDDVAGKRDKGDDSAPAEAETADGESSVQVRCPTTDRDEELAVSLRESVGERALARLLSPGRVDVMLRGNA